MADGRRNSDIPRNRPFVIQISLEKREMELSIKYISFPRNIHRRILYNLLSASLYCAHQVIANRNCKSHKRLHVDISFVD